MISIKFMFKSMLALTLILLMTTLTVKEADATQSSATRCYRLTYGGIARLKHCLSLYGEWDPQGHWGLVRLWKTATHSFADLNTSDTWVWGGNKYISGAGPTGWTPSWFTVSHRDYYIGCQITGKPDPGEPVENGEEEVIKLDSPSTNGCETWTSNVQGSVAGLESDTYRWKWWQY